MRKQMQIRGRTSGSFQSDWGGFLGQRCFCFCFCDLHDLSYPHCFSSFPLFLCLLHPFLLSVLISSPSPHSLLTSFSLHLSLACSFLLSWFGCRSLSFLLSTSLRHSLINYFPEGWALKERIYMSLCHAGGWILHGKFDTVKGKH